MKNIKEGGYIAFRAFDSDEKKLFTGVMDGFVGVLHTPLAVATAVSAGTNYAFLCESKPVVIEAVSYNSLVIIHKPLPHEDKAPFILEIRKVEII